MAKWYYVYPDKLTGRDKDWDFYENSPAWSNNPITATKYVEEYKLVGIDMLIDEIECDTLNDFVEYIRDTHNGEITPYNEITIYYSEIHPEIYHAKTYLIDDSYATGGLTDAQSRYIEQAVCRSTINMINLSNYMKIPNMKNNLLRLLRDYVQLYVLLENSDISDVNEYNMKLLADGGYTDVDLQEGIFAMIDMVAYDRICAGVPI